MGRECPWPGRPFIEGKAKEDWDAMMDYQCKRTALCVQKDHSGGMVARESGQNHQISALPQGRKYIPKAMCTVTPKHAVGCQSPKHAPGPEPLTAFKSHGHQSGTGGYGVFPGPLQGEMTKGRQMCTRVFQPHHGRGFADVVPCICGNRPLTLSHLRR